MKLLREPFFQFVLLGLVLFAAYAIVEARISGAQDRRIDITGSEIDLLAATFERRWQRPPTEGELRHLVEARVREEVLYREAVAAGLDEDDAMVRRRMVQKMELLTEDLSLSVDPSDGQLRTFFQERREDYRIPPLLSFSHVYFNMDERGAAGELDSRRLLGELRADSAPPEVAAGLGDRFMLGHDYALLSPEGVGREFGAPFAEGLFELEPGWQGPIPSGFGLHLVYVGERVESRVPEFAEIRDELRNDFNRMRRSRGNEALYEGLSTRYEVTIDEEALREASITDPP